MKEGVSLPKNAFRKYLRNDDDFSWFLRRCCSKTLNFDNTVPLPKYTDDDQLTCPNMDPDEEEMEKMNEEEEEGREDNL